MYGPEAADHPLLDQARRAATLAARGEVIEVTHDILAKVSRRDNPQAVVGVFPQAFTPLGRARARRRARASSRCTGCATRATWGPSSAPPTPPAAAAVILVGECCDPYSVEAVRATMGSIFAVPLARAARRSSPPGAEAWPGSVVGTLLTADDRLPRRRLPPAGPDPDGQRAAGPAAGAWPPPATST